jgi:hypothetical protein
MIASLIPQLSSMLSNDEGIKSEEISAHHAFRRSVGTYRDICTMHTIQVMKYVSITTIHAAGEWLYLYLHFLDRCSLVILSRRLIASLLVLLCKYGIPHLLFFLRRFHNPSAIIDNTSNGNPNPSPKPKSNLCPFPLFGVKLRR